MEVRKEVHSGTFLHYFFSMEIKLKLLNIQNKEINYENEVVSLGTRIYSTLLNKTKKYCEQYHNSQLSWLLPISFWRIFFHFANHANIAGFLVLIHTQQFDDFFFTSCGRGKYEKCSNSTKNMQYVICTGGRELYRRQKFGRKQKRDLFVCVIK